MNRPLLLGLLINALLLAGFVSLRGDLLALAVPLALYLLYGYWRAPAELQLDVHRHLSAERVAPGQPVVVTLTLVNRGAALHEILVQDFLPPGLTVTDGASRHLATLKRGASVTCTYTVSGPRGYYGFTSTRVEARDDLGLVQRTETFAAPGQMLVLPPLVRLKRVAIRPRRTRVYAGTIPARTGGPGVDFFGVRAYQPGDATRSLNWRVTARHPEGLFANEFEQERVADVGIILDGRDRTNRFGGGHSLFEHSVLATAALTDALISQGNRVGMLVYGQFLQWTFSGYGKFQRERIMQALGAARPGGSEIFSNLEHIPARLFPINSQLVIVSPLVADDLDVLVQLRARGYQVMVISPDPAAFELDCLPATPEVEQAGRVIKMERELLLANLRRAGIQVLNWNVNHPFDRAIHTSLGRPPQWLRAIGRHA
jgi:uncharacterized protein (DUF58 family)